MTAITRFASFALLAWAVQSSGYARGDTIIAPNALAGAEGNFLNQNALSFVAATNQLMISASQLAGMPVSSAITGLRFRQDGAATGDGPAATITWADYQITLAQAATSLASPSSTFADNMLNPVLVRGGALSIAAGSFPGGGSPNAFGPVISFNQTPYTYQGGDLVVLLSHTNSDGSTLVPIDSADLSTPGYGTDFRSLLAAGFQATTSANNSGSFPVVQFEFSPAAVPEPSSLILAGVGALSGLGFGLWRRRRIA